MLGERWVVSDPLGRDVGFYLSEESANRAIVLEREKVARAWEDQGYKVEPYSVPGLASGVWLAVRGRKSWWDKVGWALTSRRIDWEE